MQVENGCAEKGVELPAAVEENPAVSIENERDLAKDYAKLQQKYAELQKRNTLEKISHETGCTDPDYLEFCAERQGISVLDAEELRRFARKMASASPGCFNARITPGSSAGNSRIVTSPAGNRREDHPGDRIGMIALSIDCAPDAV